MSDLFSRQPKPPIPLPSEAKVIPIHADGVYVRLETRDIGDDVYWAGRRRGGRSFSEVAYSLEELEELRDRINSVLKGLL